MLRFHKPEMLFDASDAAIDNVKPAFDDLGATAAFTHGFRRSVDGLRHFNDGFQHLPELLARFLMQSQVFLAHLPKQSQCQVFRFIRHALTIGKIFCFAKRNAGGRHAQFETFGRKPGPMTPFDPGPNPSFSHTHRPAPRGILAEAKEARACSPLFPPRSRYNPFLGMAAAAIFNGRCK